MADKEIPSNPFFVPSMANVCTKERPSTVSARDSGCAQWTYVFPLIVPRFIDCPVRIRQPLAPLWTRMSFLFFAVFTHRTPEEQQLLLGQKPETAAYDGPGSLDVPLDVLDQSRKKRERKSDPKTRTASTPHLNAKKCYRQSYLLRCKSSPNPIPDRPYSSFNTNHQPIHPQKQCLTAPAPKK